jgi:hypothetical protein
MSDVKLSLPSVMIVAAIVGAGAFAVGRSTGGAPSTASASGGAAANGASGPNGMGDQALPPGHPATGGMGATGGDLPSGHPAVTGAELGATGAAGAMGAMGGDGGGAAAEGALSWKAPARWQSVPNTSSMRLATYRVPHAPGDAEDPDLSVMQAGGSVDANVQRWIGQFDSEGQKTAKRSTKKVSGLEVTILEVEGTYAGGMGKDRGDASGWALLGAVVATPGMPHFFKLTGPAKSVKAARAEFDQLVATFASR